LVTKIDVTPSEMVPLQEPHKLVLETLLRILHAHGLNGNNTRRDLRLGDEYNPYGFFVLRADDRRCNALRNKPKFFIPIDRITSAELRELEPDVGKALVPATKEPLPVSGDVLPRCTRSMMRDELVKTDASKRLEILHTVRKDGCNGSKSLEQISARGLNALVSLDVRFSGGGDSLFRAGSPHFLSEKADLPNGSNAIHGRVVKEAARAVEHIGQECLQKCWDSGFFLPEGQKVSRANPASVDTSFEVPTEGRKGDRDKRITLVFNSPSQRFNVAMATGTKLPRAI